MQVNCYYDEAELYKQQSDFVKVANPVPWFI